MNRNELCGFERSAQGKGAHGGSLAKVPEPSNVQHDASHLTCPPGKGIEDERLVTELQAFMREEENVMRGSSFEESEWRRIRRTGESESRLEELDH